MLSEYSFFSFLCADTDDARHEYNHWGVMDHTPENRRLAGVAWGDRWERTQDCKEHSIVNDSHFESLEFLTMYWFRNPADESLEEWNKLAEDTFQWGRGALIPGISRALAAFFVPAKGYAAQRILSDADVLPFRPHRGVHITLSHFPATHSSETHEQYTWYDRVRIPDLLGVDGVAGVWTFSLDREQNHPKIPLSTARGFQPTSLRATLIFLDDDPVEVCRVIDEKQAGWALQGRGAPRPEAEQILFSSPLRTIDPWAVVAEERRRSAPRA